MPTIKTWCIAVRLPSVLLAASTITMGNVLAFGEGKWKVWVGIWALITAVLLQIIANLANDYGDFLHGSAVGGRVAQGGGGVTLPQIQRAIVWLVVLTIISGLILLQVADLSPSSFFKFTLLGAVAIVAAITYTMGPKPYAYIGLGDLSVFLFFGFIGVVGTTYLHTQVWNNAYLLPACSCGCLAVAILNLNNIRDINEDTQVAKKTLAVRLGRKVAIWYQWVLLLGGVMGIGVFTWIQHCSPWQWMFIGSIPRLIQNGMMTMRLPAEQLNKVLQRLVWTYLYLVLLFGIGTILRVYFSY